MAEGKRLQGIMEREYCGFSHGHASRQLSVAEAYTTPHSSSGCNW